MENFAHPLKLFSQPPSIGNPVPDHDQTSPKGRAKQ